MEKLICAKETPLKGRGIFAVCDIRKGEIISSFTGPRVKIEHLDEYPQEVVDHLFNVGTDEYILAKEPEVRTNHSCDPNAGIVNDVCLIAMRDIRKDEEITFDYSIIINDDWVLNCLCGSPICRGIIGKYRDLPQEIKLKYSDYTPQWIKNT